MLLWIAIVIAVIYAFLKPYGDGFLDTSMWVSKILAPADTDDIKESKQFLKMNQAALLDGWPSNIPFSVTILGVSAIVLGFIYSWWGGLLMFVILGFGAGTTKFFLTRQVTYFLTVLCGRLGSRYANYRRDNDSERASAIKELQLELEKIMAIYLDSGIKVPSQKQIKSNPCGDAYYLWSLYSKIDL